MNFLYLELNGVFIEIETIESYGRLRISISESIDDKNMVDDLPQGKMKIGDLIFVNPLSADKKVKTISFYNPVVRDKELLTDVILLEMSNGQVIFIDPGFLGINIGGEEQKGFWENNLPPNASPKIMQVEID